MWRLLLIVAVLGAVTVQFPSVLAVKGLMYMRQIDSMLDEFLSSGDNLKVVYFGRDFAAKRQFLVEMEKSAAILALYDVELALVDCTVNSNVGDCMAADSSDNVYMYQNNYLLIKISVNSMFDIDSIVSNVLQCVLLYDAPILQTVGERAALEAESKGHMDIVYTYQKALGTYAHRIMMEVAYAHRSEYRFAVTNEYEPVKDLPGFWAGEESAVWFLLCKQVVTEAQPCAAVKYTGVMDRNNLARYFRVRDLPAIHDVGHDGDFDPFTENDLHTVFIHYDASSQSAARRIASQLIDVFLGRLGVVLANVDEVAVDTAKFGPRRNLLAVSVQLLNEDRLRYMPDGYIPTQFVAEQLHYPVAPPGESVESSVVGTPTADSQDSASEDVLKQDDEVAEAVAELQKMESFYDMNNILQLDSTTFWSVTKDRRQTIMVLFYVTFDARSEVVLATYNDLAKDLAVENLRPLAAIDCFSWTDACQLANVSAFPLIRIYRPDADFVPYLGYLSKAALYATIKLHLTESPVLLKSVSDVEEFINYCPPQEISANSCVLGLYGTSDKNEIEKFDTAAAEMHGEIAFGRSSDVTATARCGKVGVPSPCILVIRRHDPVSRFSTISPEGSTETIVKTIRQARLSSLPELTAGEFASYYALGRPFLIAFINVFQLSSSASSLVPIMEELARSNGPFDGKVVCAWMDVSNPAEAAGQVLHHHVMTPRTEELLLIDRESGSVHRFEGPLPLALNAVQKWLDLIMTGNMMPTGTLSTGEWRPTIPPFDFLAYVDADEARRQADGTPDRLSYLNEHGIGVPADEVAVPVKDIDEAVQSEMNKLHHSRLRTTGTGSKLSAEHSEKQPKIVHTEL